MPDPGWIGAFVTLIGAACVVLGGDLREERIYRELVSTVVYRYYSKHYKIKSVKRLKDKCAWCSHHSDEACPVIEVELRLGYSWHKTVTTKIHVCLRCNKIEELEAAA